MADGMNDKPAKPIKTEAERRAERLALQLRSNLQRRKAQTRARRDGDADLTDGLPAAEGDGNPEG